MKSSKQQVSNKESLKIAGYDPQLERVTEKGFFVDEAGDAYLNTPDGLLLDGEYIPEIHGLFIPLAKRQRSKLKIGTA